MGAEAPLADVAPARTTQQDLHDQVPMLVVSLPHVATLAFEATTQELPVLLPMQVLYGSEIREGHVATARLDEPPMIELSLHQPERALPELVRRHPADQVARLRCAVTVEN